MTLFDKVSLLCNENNTTLAALERSLGFANGSVKKWANAYPSADRVAKVAKHFDVSTDYLLGLTETPNKNLIVGPEQEELLYIYNEVSQVSKAALLREARYLLGSEQYQNRAFTTGHIAAKGGDSETFEVKPPWEDEDE